MAPRINDAWLVPLSSLLWLSPSNVNGEDDVDVPIVISLRLNVAEVNLGEKVILTEMVPKNLKVPKTVAIAHRALLVGEYDEKSGSLVNLKPETFRGVGLARAFHKLPLVEISDHGMARLEYDKSTGME